ncbi:glutathione S-transferase 1-like [Artemia franciscana]|uniref:glutathione S-transferase 1-like n=1 Tax=Artemia franciscana TaxID=6661 RepID=UPI0032DAE906
MPSIDLYYMPLSAPCRSIMMLAKALDVHLNLKLTDLMKGEHMRPEYLKMNPQHTIPTIDDNGFYLWESRAILQYLANQYAKNDTLYPKDPKARAIVDNRLYFDMGTLYQKFGEYYYPVMFKGATSLDEEKRKELDNALQLLEGYLTQHKYVAGDHLTIADFALLATVETIEAVDSRQIEKPHIRNWLNKCRSEVTGYKELNADGAAVFGGMAKGALQKIQA